MSTSTALTPVAEVCSNIERMKPHFQQALPSNVSVDRFTRVVLTAVQQNPALLEADRRSLYNACVRAAQDGLLPDNRQGALVTFNAKQGDRWVKSVQWMPMRQGLIDKAAKYGIGIDAEVVCENDDFEYELGDNPTIHHKAPKLGKPRGEVIGAYAIATLKDGKKKRAILTRQDIDKIRAASRSKDAGPWVSWFDEMAKKSAIRRLYKSLPMGDMDEADRNVLETEDDFADLPPPEMPPAEVPPPAPEKPTRPRAVAAAVAKAKAKQAPTKDSNGNQVDPETGEIIEGKVEAEVGDNDTDDVPI